MSTLYDAEILQQYADDLYRQAKWIVLNTAARFAIIGFILFLGIGFVAKTQVPELEPLPTAAGGAFIAGVLGAFVGQGKVFDLKLKAQTIMCQRQIEVNTRPTSPPQVVASPE